MRAGALFALLLAATSVQAETYHLIPGAVPLDKGPDGNTVVLDAPDGLIVFDTGRHPEHAQAIIDYAEARHRPIAAVYASGALQGALATFLKDSRANTDKLLADPKTSAATRDQLLRGRAVIDHPERIRPDHVITRSGAMRIAGRTLDIHLARFAATEGDVWIYDRRSRTAFVGDLVVGLVPFMDTACAAGWSRALQAITAVPFKTLVPGHGSAMSRADFLTWRRAFDAFVACGSSSTAKERCVDQWQHNAAKFIDPEHRQYVRDAAAYYIDTRLRSSPKEQQRYCKPLRAS